MTPAPRPSLTGEPFGHVSRFVRLPLSDDRAVVVEPMISQVMGYIDTLDELDLDEVSPATAFDARWD